MSLMLLASWMVLGAAQPVKVDIPAAAPIRGPRYAKVTIVEWADFECPASRKAEDALGELLRLYGDDVRLVFMQQPVALHQNAHLAAEAALAAGAQGRFWQMHDLLFRNQGALGLESLQKYARDLGLDLDDFDRALLEDRYGDRVDADVELGRAAGAGGTPAFFINGAPVSGEASRLTLKDAIDAQLVKAEAALASGVPLEHLYEHLQRGALVHVQPASPSLTRAQ